jgi:hypothetical protein
MRGVTNCVIAANGYGVYPDASKGQTLTCTRISYGMTIDSNEDSRRDGRVFYPIREDHGSFVVRVVFSSYQRKVDFTTWLLGYVQALANAGTSTSAGSGAGAARVQVLKLSDPKRPVMFDKIGVFNQGLVMGDDYRAVTYTLDLGFAGASDSVGFDSKTVSSFSVANSIDTSAPYFYPGGKDLVGQDAPDNFYDTPLPVIDASRSLDPPDKLKIGRGPS